MNDGFNDSNSVSDSESDIGNDTESSEGSANGNVSETSYGSDTAVSVPDAVEYDFLLSSDSETDSETFADMEEADSEVDLEYDKYSQQIETLTYSPDYLPELEYIDYILHSQLDEMRSVKTVSGNSIYVSLDDSGTELLTDIHEKQNALIVGQNAIFSLLSCILLVLTMEYLINSAKRIMKKMSFRKE